MEGKDDESDYRIKSLAGKNMLRPGTLAYCRVRSLMLGQTGVNPLIGGTTPETFTNFFQMFYDTRHGYVMHDLIQDTGGVMDGMLYELVRRDGQCYLSISRDTPTGSLLFASSFPVSGGMREVVEQLIKLETARSNLFQSLLFDEPRRLPVTLYEKTAATPERRAFLSQLRVKMSLL